jgi:hypothetical protein
MRGDYELLLIKIDDYPAKSLQILEINQGIIISAQISTELPTFK